MYEFFKSCLKTAEGTYNALIKTPRARGSHLQKEIYEILTQIDTSLKYNEITPAQAQELKNAFIKLDFQNLAAARQAREKSLKMKK